ncbi:hypothetical protein F5H01DRAFT_114789 [Linnemannia elongata]|nr:hypothetical protein F5H01DRAFT_114789 [Linnemannia elongata]
MRQLFSSSSSPSTSTRILFALACLLSFSNNNNNIQFVNAQGQPQPCGGAAYKVVGKKFYVHGGSLQGDQLLQSLWALDLTTSWTTSTPAWTPLALGPYNAYHSGGRSADNKTFIVFGRDTAAEPNVIPNSFVNIFDIPSGTWKEVNPQGINDNSRRDFDVVTNPSANKVYILGGDAGPAGSIYSNMFTTYDVATQSVTEVTTPAPGPQSVSTYSAVWSAKLNAMVVIGGNYKAGGAAQGLLLYHPDTGYWTTQTTNGPFNYGRSSACAATNGDGSLIAVFGGFIGGAGPGDPNIYILNTATWTWTVTKYPGQGRGNAACAIVDDTFMVWGGFLASPNTLNGVPTGADALLLYSLSKSQWQTTYTPSAAMSGGNSNSTGYPGGTYPPSGGTGSNPDGSGGNHSQGLSAGALGGIIGGVVAVLALAIFGIVCWHKRRKHPPPGKDTSYETAGVNSMEEHHRPGVSPPRPPPPGFNTTTGQYQSLKLSDEALFDPRLSVDGSYGNGEGYSTATTPTTLNFLNTNEHRPERGRQSYQSDGSVYYPPPPTAISHQPTIPEDSPYMSEHSVTGSGRRFNDPQSLNLDTSGVANYQYAGLTGPATAPSVGPGYASTGSDYHDGGFYADRDREKYLSGISSQTGYSRISSGSDPQAILYPNTSPPMPKRIVSGPQGGEGFGFVIEPAPPGAPQALLEHQRSFLGHQEQLQPQPLEYQQGQKMYQSEPYRQPLPQSPPPLMPRPSIQPQY